MAREAQGSRQRIVDCFDRVFVINLPERTDRREETARELTANGFGASDASGDKVRYVAVPRPDSAGPFPTVGARGCFLSHVHALELAAAEGVGHVLIIEDDVQFPNRFGEMESRLVELLEADDWDVVQLGYHKPPGEPLPFPDRTELSFEPFSDEVLGTVCYAVRGAFLPTLIEFLHGLLNGPPHDDLHGPMPIDGALNVLAWRMPDARRRLAAPVLVEQRISRSDVTPRWFDEYRLARVPISFARRVKAELVRRRAKG